ncbi:MAG: proline--tRNA ligase [Lentisphaeria bacterium]|nr:proline--tRNA ligase [Lentisphaeria bacterium]
MRLSQMIGQRLREAPRDAQTISHKFLARGGYCLPVSAGIFTLLPLGYRITQKIEQIIREEMDAIGGQELLMPVALTAELWQQSGRWESVGAELLRFKDRNGKDMMLGMTHEEACVHAVRANVSSYKQLPLMVYQIQTKYRDEARPRAGLIRTREFTMKDAYSFHTTQEDLERYYVICHQAYTRIFKRIGFKNFISIQADSGIFGGNRSDEFMAIADCGEDTLFVSPNGNYQANREVACANLTYTPEEPAPIEKVATPHAKTIAEVAEFLGVDAAHTCKAVFYKDSQGKLVFVNIRGDLEVNETKLAKVVKDSNLAFADDELIRSVGAVPGFASLYGLDFSQIRVVVDPSVVHSNNLVAGANEEQFHLKNFNYDRDVADKERVIVADIACVRDGDPSPVDGAPLKLLHGIEIGNIFQLGTKYSKPMECNYLDMDGKAKPMIMGCYGIGVGRSVAAIVEQCHDDYGPIWPMSIAPYQVHIIGLKYSEEAVKNACETLYADLRKAGVEVLLDDRGEKAGSAFADADLMGIPLRVVISPKTLATGEVEFKHRDWGKNSQMLPLQGLVEKLQEEIRQALAELNA